MQEQGDVHRAGEWQVQELRATVFPLTPPPLTGQTRWQELVGGAPDVVTVNHKTGQQREEGCFEGGKLSLTLQPDRIDWRLEADPQVLAPGLDLIGPLSKVLPPFRELVHRWLQLDSVPGVQRLAFGATVLQPTASREEGYRLVAPYLPAVEIDPEGSTDLLFQINRPRISQSGPAGLKLNRLSHWSVLLTQLVEFMVGPQRRAITQSDGHFAARLHLDVNTAADFSGVLERTILETLFDELVELAEEIAREGDRR
jgi:hypothetical protein